MLSIGKLATGQARYYLEQAGGRVDRVTSVASGVEDYYFEASEPDGVWVGAGGLPIARGGSVAAEALHRILEGAHPVTGEPLGRHPAVRVPGFDVTFSASKSVSVMFGVGDEAMRRQIRDAHDVAVRDAFGYLERHAAVARRGPGGCISVRGNGLVAAAFRHRASRAGDPQLHTHVVVANLVQAADGRWSALDARRLYAHGKTAGYLYEARLRSELTRRLGVEWTPTRNGIADIVGVPRPALRAFSRRRAEIEAELEERGQRGARAAQTATLETRRQKDHGVTAGTLEAEWRDRAKALGFAPERVRDVCHREVPTISADRLDETIASSPVQEASRKCGRPSLGETSFRAGACACRRILGSTSHCWSGSRITSSRRATPSRLRSVSRCVRATHCCSDATAAGCARCPTSAATPPAR